MMFDYREGAMVPDASFKAGGGRSPKPRNRGIHQNRKSLAVASSLRAPQRELAAGGIFKPTDS